MAITDADGWFTGEGIKSAAAADSGVVTISATPTTLTASFATVGGTQPTITHGWAVLAIYGLTGGSVVGQIDWTIDDGTTTETFMSMPGPVAAAANRGGSWRVAFWVSGLSLLINIINVKAIIAFTVANAGSAELRVNGGY